MWAPRVFGCTILTPYKFFFSRFLSVPALALTAGCGGGDGPGVTQLPPAPTPATVVVAPGTTTLVALGRTVQLTATVRDQRGQTLSGVSVSWSSSATGVTTVDAAGLVTAVANGSATITATAGSASGSAQVAVEQAASSVEISAPRDTLAVGGSLQLTATVLDGNGHRIDSLALEWSSSDTTVATVDQEGWVVGVADGSVAIAAASGEVGASVHLTVQRHADPVRGALIALYERTSGPDWKNNENWLSDAPLEDWYGVTTDSEGRVTRLALVHNGLKGTIPPQLEHLKDLQYMWLYSNELSGAIPPELGSLPQLRHLALSANGFSGPIPPELGLLTNLTTLWLPFNDLSGAIPPELGDLKNLEAAWLYNNELEGPIPPELGRLAKLTDLQLHANELSGIIPPELGNLSALATLWLYRNNLTGPVPPELGDLPQLAELALHENRLRGPLPPELGKLARLTRLQLNDNAGLSGLLPLELTGLTGLTDLLLDATGLCAPNDPGFRDWLAGLTVAEVALCRQGGAPFYLIQAVQSLEDPVPLVAGRDALLRVFPVALQSTEEPIPPVHATFYADGAPIHTLEIPAGSTALPIEFADGPLALSANGLVPGSVLRPGVEMVIEVDPDTTATLRLGVHERIPETGRLSLEVLEMPPLDLTLVPFLWRSDPDTAFVRRVGELTAAHELLWDTRNLLPTSRLDVTIHDAVQTDLEPVFENGVALLREVEALRLIEGSTRHYMGMLPGAAGGKGFIPGKSSVSELHASTMAHELGHNMSLWHAPCDVTETLDPRYPHERGAIGARGYDIRDGRLVPPQANDLMGYCRPRWISDYHFTRAAEHRLEADASLASRDSGVDRRTRTLLLWGGVKDGRPVLDPSFVVDATPQLPAGGGPYWLEGIRGSGEVLFSLGFDMPEQLDGSPGERAFVFTLPVPNGWGELAKITLSGPEGTVSLARDGESRMALLLDELSGRVRGFLRDPDLSADGAVAVALQPGLQIQISGGVPDRNAWRGW